MTYEFAMANYERNMTAYRNATNHTDKVRYLKYAKTWRAVAHELL